MVRSPIPLRTRAWRSRRPRRTKEGWKTGLQAVLQAQADVLATGFRQDEVDRQISVFRTALQSAKAGAATRTTPALANELLKSVDDAEVFLHPAEALDVVEMAFKGLTAEQVNAAFRQCFSGNGPLVFMSTPDPVDGGDAALAAAFADKSQQTAAADKADVAMVWPYTDFGPAGHVAEQTTVDDLGLTYVRFDNGVRLTVKPTKFRDEQILVAATFGNGRVGLDGKTMPPLWAADGGAFALGGLKDLPVADIQRLLAGKAVNAKFSTAERYFSVVRRDPTRGFHDRIAVVDRLFHGPRVASRGSGNGAQSVQDGAAPNGFQSEWCFQ